VKRQSRAKSSPKGNSGSGGDRKRKATERSKASGTSQRAKSASSTKPKTPSKAAKTTRKGEQPRSTPQASDNGRAAPIRQTDRRQGSGATVGKGQSGGSGRNRRTPKARSKPVEGPANGMIETVDGDRPLPKTHLKSKELREFKELLLAKRAELCGDLEHLTDEALYRSRRGESEGATMPIHMADLGSDNWEQDFTLGLVANERALVRELDEALERIENKTYGICLATHRKIDTARLRAKPWAKYCIEYARAKEEGRVL